MRVASNTLYNASVSGLSRVNAEMLKVNKQITTGKRINSLADDPVGLSRVVSLRSSVANLEQFKTNISIGRTWIETAESSLSTVGDLVTESKTLSIGMVGIVNDADRFSGAEQIQGYLDQIIALANTTIQGHHMFSGTKTEVKTYTLETTGTRTQAVYGGNESAFKVKMAPETNIDVGYDGRNIFESSTITIDETNNKIDFMEDPTGGSAFYGAELTATISNGEYTPDELAIAVGAAMTARSAWTGQAEVVEVTQSNATVVVDNYEALTVPTGGTNIDLTYTAATNTWSVADVPAGYTAGITPLQLESDADKVVLDFTGDGTGDMTIDFSSSVADAYSVSFDITAAAAGGNGVTYNASHNEGIKKYTISEVGGPALTSLSLKWATGTNKETSLGVDMGFDSASDDTGVADGTNHVSDNDVEWGILRTLIDLKGYLEQSDTAGINRSISRLTADFNHIESYISETGIKQNRLDIRENVIEDLSLSYETNRMKIEDADVIESFSLLQQKQFAYQAALSSTAKILNMSILDFI